MFEITSSILDEELLSTYFSYDFAKYQLHSSNDYNRYETYYFEVEFSLPTTFVLVCLLYHLDDLAWQRVSYYDFAL